MTMPDEKIIGEPEVMKNGDPIAIKHTEPEENSQAPPSKTMPPTEPDTDSSGVDLAEIIDAILGIEVNANGE